MKRMIEYKRLEASDAAGWDQVAAMFESMYMGMEKQGLMLGLAPDGAAKWIETTRHTAGKFGLVILATLGPEAVGFAHGMIRFLPDYLGGHVVGSITHIYVRENWRKEGVGSKLADELEAWFRSRPVHSIELQVISHNQEGISFWKHLGYSGELVQYRKLIKQ